MGKIEQGILGGFSGKVGNVVGGNWKGIDYMRIKPANVENPRTEDQLDQRSKFVTVLKFLQPLTVFIREGFAGYAVKMTEFNNAMSYNLNNAVSGVYPDYTIDYANALVSRGSRKGALNPAVASSAPGQVEFTWDDNSGEVNAGAADKAMLVVYNSVKKDAEFVTAGADRTAGNQTVTVPDAYSGDTVQAFIAFKDPETNQVSNSIYVGSVDVASV